MRFVLLALMLSCLLTANLAYANDSTLQHDKVKSLKTALAKKESEYALFVNSLATLQQKVSDKNQALTNTKNRSDELTVLRKKALIQMNEQYELLIDNPDQNITAAQNKYRKTVIALKDNKKEVTLTISQLNQLKAKLELTNIKRFSLANARESLIEQIARNRALRLHKEFEKQEQLKVSRSFKCSIQETLKTCITRSHSLAKKKASKAFLSSLFENATESVLIRKHKKDSMARVEILKHEIISGQFSGQGSYTTQMSVTLKGSLPKYQSCILLDISKRYCVDIPGEAASNTDNNSDKDNTKNGEVMYEVTIRSDQYDDEVFIDGVSYGSTKLTTMLTKGSHVIVISKQGYQGYQKNIYINRNILIKTSLKKLKINVAIGEKIQDILANDSYGPELIGIAAGSIQFEVLKGSGIDNEKPVKNTQVLNSFAIGQSQITVGDFKTFVDATQYVTDAELSGGCAANVDGVPTYNSVLNWRNPGFEQLENHPVVCVSEKDSQSYLSWLSNVTERNYRLPKETEWEYVARAGNEDDYWWGNDIGAAQANCAFCGSKWSNISTSPIKSFRANRFGLFDTVGNVWELTNGNKLIARGGSWNFTPKLSKISVRLALSKDFRSNYLGFRVLREN